MIYIAVLCNSTESPQNPSTILPLFIGPYAAATVRRLSMKALAIGTKLYCLVNRGTLGVTNLPRVVARIMPRLESNPRPLDHKSDAPPLHYRATSAGETKSREDRKGGGQEERDGDRGRRA